MTNRIIWKKAKNLIDWNIISYIYSMCLDFTDDYSLSWLILS